MGLTAPVTLLVLWVGGASAAEPTDVPTRPSDRPIDSPGFLRERPAGSVEVPLVPERQNAIPEGGPTLQVDKIAFEGNRVIASDDLLALARPFAGRRLSASDIEDLRNRVTRLYIDRGYINSGALIEEGAYRDGKLTFTIIEGRVEQFRVSGLERLHESYVRDRLSPRGEVFNVNHLQERFQLLLGDPLFANVRAQVLPGSTPGQAIVDVALTRAQPYQFSVFANNHRSPSVGSEAGGASGWVRNLTGFGDVFDALYQVGRGGPAYGVGWSVPVSGHGTSIEARFDQGRSSLIEEPVRAIGIESEFKSLAVGISQPVVVGLQRRLVLGLSWAHRESTSTIGGVPFSFVPGEVDGKTKLQVWRFFQDFQQRGERSALSARSTFSFGRNNIGQDQVPATTPQREFRVWLGQFQYAHEVANNGARALLRGFVQATSDRLVPLERTAVGGAGTVRGYRENQLVRDKGYAMSAEFHYPALGPASAKRALDLIAFADHGAARNQDEATERLASVGVGIQGHYRGFGAELYIARRLRDRAVNSGSNLQDKGIHVAIRYDIS